MADEVAQAAADLFRRRCPPELVAAAEGGWSPELWRELEASGLAAVGAEASREEAAAAVRTAARFAAPVPFADTVLAQWLGEAESGPLTVADGGRAAYGRFARISGGRRVVEEGLNLAGEPLDQVEPAGERLQPLGALVRAIQIAGALDTVLELTVTYAEQRQQFGRPLIRFQAVQQELALLAGEVLAAGAAVDAAVERPEAELAAMAKIRAGEAAGVAAALAHQVHGAIGFTDEHRLQQYTRRLWSWRDDFGSEAEWADWLAGRLTDGLWEMTS